MTLPLPIILTILITFCINQNTYTGKVFNPFKDAIFLQKIWSEKLNSEHKEKILLGRKVNLLPI